MAKIITVYNSKGGSGKSTLVFSIYNYLRSQGAKVAICDTDYQKSLSNLENTLHLVVPSQLDKTSYKIVLVDTPPYRSDITLEILGKTDFLLIPARPSIFDCKAAMTVVLDARERKLKHGIVLNMVKGGTKFTGEIREWLENQGLPVFKTEIADRVAYARALLYGSIEDEANEKANNEIKDLTNELLTKLL